MDSQVFYDAHEQWYYPKHLEEQYNPVIDPSNGLRRYFVVEEHDDFGQLVCRVCGDNAGVVVNAHERQMNRQNGLQQVLNYVAMLHKRNSQP